MRKKFSGRGGMLLAFLVGCVVATAATAGAATLITGKQIKNGTITSKDLSKALRKQIAKAGTAGAAGAVGATGETGAKGDSGTAGAKGDKGDKGDPGTPATRLFAHVKSDGALNYGSGATAVSHPSTGQYTVNFNRSLANCASVITPGWGNPTGSDFNAGPLNAWQWETGNSVQVYLYNNAGTAANSSFHIAVFC